MKKSLSIIMLVTFILSVFTVLSCWLDPTVKVWQQIKSEAKDAAASDVEYALKFTIRSSGKKFEIGERPEGLSASMIEIDKSKNRFMNDSPHKGHSPYIGTWETGYNSDGDLVFTMYANPSDYRRIHQVPEEHDVLVETIISAEGFHDLHLSHIFYGKGKDS